MSRTVFALLGVIVVVVLVVGALVVVRPGAAGAPPSPVVGIVTGIDSSGLAQVHGFTLRTSSGETLTFVLGQLENGAQFPPGHLAEHQATAGPVRVYFRDQGGQLVVYRLEDASG